MQPARQRRGALQLRTKLIVLLAPPILLSTLTIAAIVWVGSSVEKGLDQATAWSKHELLLGDLRRLTVAVVQETDRAIAAGERPRLEGLRSRMKRTTTASVEAARRWPDELAEEREVERAMSSLVERAGQARSTADLLAVRRAQNAVLRRLDHRIAEERSGVASAVSGAADLTHRMLVIVSVACTVALLAGLILGLAVARSVGRSIERLRDHARRLAEGDLDAEVPVEAADELGELAMAFNHMALRLRETMYTGAQLQEGIAARTAELERTTRELEESVGRLQDAQSQALRAERLASVGVLAASVAHEINNPLTYVVSNLELARESLEELAADSQRSGGPGSERALASARECIGEASEGAVRVRDIVRDLRVFTRASDDQLGPVDVHAVLTLVGSMARNQIRHRATLVEVRQDLPAVRGNEGRLCQVFLNLVINAVQAFPERDAALNELRIETRLEGARVVVEVADNGVGIPPENLARIFDPFFTTKAAGAGTGLGLAVCRRFLGDIGGQIDVESTVGRGTTFRVSLPVDGAVRAPVPPPAPRPVAPLPPGSVARILVVDDEPMVASAMKRILGGYDVVIVESGEAALARIGNGEHFDLVLCDLMMPGMGGVGLHEHLRAMAPQVAAQMLFVSGGAFTADHAAFLAGMAGRHIEKPISPATLREVVKAALAGKLG